MAELAIQRDAGIPEAVLAGWQRVLEQWDTQLAHDALLNVVARDGCYAWAAARYREVTQARPGDPIAQRELARLVRAAEASLRATATVQSVHGKSPYQASTVILVLLVTALAIGLMLAMIMRRSGPRPPPPPSPSAAPSNQ